MFGRAWRTWKRVAEIIGGINARIFLSIFYFTIVVPFAIPYRLLADPMQTRNKHRSRWTPKKMSPPTIDHARKQFV